MYLFTGEMAIPHYTGKMTDWIMNEDEPEAFTHAITIMSLITIMRWALTAQIMTIKMMMMMINVVIIILS